MTEHGIKSLAKINGNICQASIIIGPYTVNQLCWYVIHIATPNLDNLSSFEIAMGRKAVLAPRFEYKPSVPTTGTHAKAHENLQENLLYFKND